MGTGPTLVVAELQFGAGGPPPGCHRKTAVLPLCRLLLLLLLPTTTTTTPTVLGLPDHTLLPFAAPSDLCTPAAARWAAMAAREGRRHRSQLVPLAALIGREMKGEKMGRPSVRHGHAAQSRKGEDFFLVKTDGLRAPPGDHSSEFAVFAIFDGHNGNAAAIFAKENLLSHVLGAMPRGLGREEWLQALPRALVAGFVKTDKLFQSRGMEF